MKPKLTVCGLGPGGPGQLTRQTEAALAAADVRYLRTERHPSADQVVDAVTFDHLYEQLPSFSGVYAGIVEVLVHAAGDGLEVVYAVPGSPLVLEESVRRLRQDDRIEVEVIPALSFLDAVWARLAVDPVDDGVRLIDGHQFSTQAAGERGPLLVAHVHAPWVLSDIKLAIDAGPEQRAVVLQRLGTDQENVFEVAWPDLDRVVEPDHLTSIFLPEVSVPVAFELSRTVALIHRLRQDCPWDREQDHQSLRKYLLEETYELLDAIDKLPAADDSSSEDRSPRDEGSPYADLEEELGDVWFQVLFHAELATEAGQFTIADVARTLHEKLVSRHPHVFGEVVVDSMAEIVSNWEQIKQTEKQRQSAMDGIPESLPALSLAEQVLQRGRRVAASVDFGGQVPAGNQLLGPDYSEATLGLHLLALVDAAGAKGLDAEGALRRAVHSARDRFRAGEADGSIADRWVLG